MLQANYLKEKYDELIADVSKLDFERSLAERRLKESEHHREMLSREFEVRVISVLSKIRAR